MNDLKKYFEKINAQKLNILGPTSFCFYKKFCPKEGIVAFVDGGIKYHKFFENFKDQVWVGDGDSLQSKIPENILCFHLPREKNFSDLDYLLKSLPISIKELNLFGLLGGELAHEFFVFGSFNRWLKRNPDGLCNFYLGQGVGVKGYASGEFKILKNGEFSVLTLEPAIVTMFGDLKYPVDGVSLDPLDSRGLHNIGLGSFSIKSDSPFFILS